MLDIKEDIREECAKLGVVTNVVLFDREPDGVASVRYADAEAARACVRLMGGRSFAGVKIEAYVADGTEKFKKSSSSQRTVEEGLGLGDDHQDAATAANQGADDESRRLDQFGEWLEADRNDGEGDRQEKGDEG